MKEYVGICNSCQKYIYCLDGFLNGVHIKEQGIVCFECYEKLNSTSSNGTGENQNDGQA